MITRERLDELAWKAMDKSVDRHDSADVASALSELRWRRKRERRTALHIVRDSLIVVLIVSVILWLWLVA